MLTVHGVSKSYSDVRALSDVSASFAPAEIHAVLGENGAGKSTLMHVLAGFALPDSGSLELDDVPVALGRPAQSKLAGIAMIHQHFTLVPAFSVEENLALASLAESGSSASMMRQAQELGWNIDPRAKTGQLSVGTQQRLEILKALSADAKVIIFDEPTAVLAPPEIQDLFRVLRRLKDEGKIVILIAHKLQEVMEIADRVTVLRQGRTVASARIDEVNPEILAEWMVGEMPEQFRVAKAPITEPMLVLNTIRLSGDRGELALAGISLSAGRGEILGIGGVDGNGQLALAEVLAGVRRADAGTVSWMEDATPKTAYIPQDRQIDGLALTMTVQENLLVAGYRRPEMRIGPFLRKRRVNDWASSLVERFSIQGSINSKVGNLSGGNQQKVVVARALDEAPDLLIAVNPTRGLDLKATRFVHERILEARDRGAVVVLISTDLDELAAVATRTVYLSKGRIVEGEGAVALLGGA